jgi:stearoyl-CoA 9-desaturase NADPH oxidoreductase
MPTTISSRRFLSSSLVDLLVGPHGIDRYLELIRPNLTIHDARADVLGVSRQTERSVTLWLRPNRAWTGFTAGQFVRVGIEIEGVRRTRTYSPATSQHRRGELELTITAHSGGLVSNHLIDHARPGSVIHLGEAQGDFVLPAQRPKRLLLICGGSGITPVMAMLRTLCDEGHDGEIAFLHYARTAADWLYQPEVRALAAQNPNVTVHFVATREGGGTAGEAGGHVSAEALAALLPGHGADRAYAAVCGPRSLIDAVTEIYDDAPERLLVESFAPPSLTLTGDGGAPRTRSGAPRTRSGAPRTRSGAPRTKSGAPRTKSVVGTLRFNRSELVAEIATGTLLEQAEAAGLTPEFGCRMGICKTCTCRKAAGAVRNVLTGEVSDEEDEDIQLCVSVPAGDVALDI